MNKLKQILRAKKGIFINNWKKLEDLEINATIEFLEYENKKGYFNHEVFRRLMNDLGASDKNE
jgi:hypothetical protein